MTTRLIPVYPAKGRKALLLALASLPFLSLSAQMSPSGSPGDAGNPDNVVKLEAVSVTGSNISRMDVEKVLPVSMLNTDAINSVQAMEPINLILSLPEVTGVPTTEASTGGAGQRGDISTVNMRGIGPAFTLLLVDGYRLAPHPIITTDNFSPNANQFPNFGIDHVDILRDGASSIYGTDAVAGVINYVMKRDRNDDEVRLRYGLPQHGGGTTIELTLATGREFPDNKGHFTVTLDSMYRDAVFATQRSFSATPDHSPQAPAPFNVATSAYNGLGGNPIWPQFYLGSGGVGPYNGQGIAPAGAKTLYFYPVASATALPSITTVAPSKLTTPWYYENLNASQMLLPRTTRFNAFATLDHQVVGRISAFADVSFYHAATTLERQPQSLVAPGSDYFKVVSANNPYNPYGSYFYSPTGAPNPAGGATLVGTPQALTLTSREIVEMGNEHIVVNDGLYRILGGLRGKFGETWSWDLGILYTRAEATDVSHETRESAFATALGNTTTATAYNPFGYSFAIQNGAVVATTPFTNSKAVVNGFEAEWKHYGFSSVGSIDLKTSGEIMDLWSGAWSAAAGGEFRNEAFGDHRPPYAGVDPAGSGLDPLNNDFITASAKLDSEGSRKVTSAYAETVLPLVAPKNHIFGVNSLEVTGSARFERYSDFGNTTRPKLGLNWKPVDFLMLRASFNEGFSAPVLPLVFYPSQFGVDTQPGTADPYYGTATGNGTYVAQGLANAATGLKPSTSIGRSVGGVLDVPFVKGLSITADYWQISQQNLVGTLSASSIMNYDQTVLLAYTQSQLAAGVNINNINAGSGTANYKGSASVVRYAPTSADVTSFAAYNATHAASVQEAVVGQVNYRISSYQNFAKAYVDGWDLGLNYAFPKTPFGRFNFSTDWTYLMRSYYISTVPGQGQVYQDRMNQNAVTRWKGTSTLSWHSGPWEADVGAFFVGRFDETGATTTAAVYQSLGAPSWIARVYSNGQYNYWPVIHDTLNYNLGVSYKIGHRENFWIRDTSLRLGVINVLDEKPPLSPNNLGFNTAAYLQLAVGRQFTFEIARHF
jgi:outer membrane receptor protein involved in Fe transport